MERYQNGYSGKRVRRCGLDASGSGWKDVRMDLRKQGGKV
jgi:hypothetical protein